MTLVQKGFQTSTAESNHKPEHSDRALSGRTPFVGGYAIVRGSFSGWNLLAVTKTTAKQFKGLDAAYSSYERTVSNDQCRFCGNEASARELLERLVSSDALCEDEKRKSDSRRVTRTETLFALARAQTGGGQP